MGQPIRIRAGDVTVAAELDESPTAAAIFAALPIEASGNRWGDEIYFSIPVDQEPAANARATVEVGELGYWPPGKAFCVFFGRTPASQDDQPRAASPINPIGRVTEGTQQLKQVPDGARVVIEQAEAG